MDHIVFELVPTNSVWMRDYGPWWIYEPNNRRAIIDLIYNRPRPQDDSFPELFAESFGVNYYGLENILTYAAFTYPITFLITDLAIDDPIIPKPIMRIFLNIKFIRCFYCLFHVTFCSNGHPNKIM